jgi:hypothetical protein
MSISEDTNVSNDFESPFDANGRQYAWDSTSYGWLVECPRKYYLAMQEGWRSKNTNVHLIWGQIFQKADEVFTKAKAEGASHDEALRSAVLCALQLSWPWPYSHTVKTREALIRSIVWYQDNRRDDAFKTVILASGKPAVELSFRLEVTPNNILCGHLDKLGEFSGANYFKDVKTTGSTISAYFFEKFDLDVQMDIYSFASKIIYKTPVQGGIIDGVQVAVGWSKDARGFTYRTNDQLDEFLEQYLWHTSTYLDEVEKAKWPMNKKACLNGRSDDPTKEATGCVFRGICSKSPQVRDEYLKSNFEKRHWNPLEVR